jgi:hypothetical protein
MNPEKPIWFRAKTYGWGWTPSTWQGWLAIAVYVVLIEASTLALLWRHATMPRIIAAIAVGVALTAALAILCYKRGEPPRWRWGRDS